MSAAEATVASDAARTSDRCPRCGGGFLCGMGGTAPCPCTTVHLSEARLAELRQRYTGCLCLGCLAELARDPAAH